MKKLLLILALIGVIVLIAYGALSGTYTTNGYFYLPGYGAYGTAEWTEYNTYMQIADTQIEANKTALTDKQPLDAQLTDIAGLTPTDSYFIVGDGVNFVTESGATARTSLGLTIGTNVQAYDASLSSIAALTYASNSFIALTAEDTYAVRTLAEVKTDLAYQLSDMSDVGVTTPTNTYVLVADGDSWESRALADGDIPNTITISDLQVELDVGAHSIGFTMQTPTGDGATLIDWTVGNHVKFTFGAQNETITFTNPSNTGHYSMIIVQDGTGSRTITWSGITFKWHGGVEPTLTTTASGEDVLGLIWDGTSWYGMLSNVFATP